MAEEVYIEIEHLPVDQGRAKLREYDWSKAPIPSIAPAMDGRWRALHKGRLLNPGENDIFLNAVLEAVSSFSDITTQRAVYYTVRGLYPNWRYKGQELGDEFYNHLVNWIMEKLQLKTGMTMQSFGVWAAPRGYIGGDGRIRTARRPWMPLSAKPALGFDLADVGVVFDTQARKVLHFEKDAGLEALLSNNFPRYIEAVFSTSQGQLSEAATKFLNLAQSQGMSLYSVHDGDPSGIQMQLLYGLATKNNCYMPGEFYPSMVKPLGFFPSMGALLGLPPEAVTEKEDGIFNNLLELAAAKEEVFPELREIDLSQEVDVIVRLRRKWEFQALNALHERAPQIYLVESLLSHGDEIKHVPDAESIKETALNAAVEAATTEVEDKLSELAQRLYDDILKDDIIAGLRQVLSPQIEAYNLEADTALDALELVPAHLYRERIKEMLIDSPEHYAADEISRLGRQILRVSFNPSATLNVGAIEITNAAATHTVNAAPPPARKKDFTRIDMANAIEEKVIKQAKTRNGLVRKIRDAFAKRFGSPSERW